MNKLNKFIFSLIICQSAGFFGSLVTAPNINNWYQALNKPSFTPPNWLFAPVWTILFILMGISLFLVWIANKKNKQKAYLLFFLQLFLNTLWSFLFFGLRLLFFAFLEIIILWFFIFLTFIYFKRINPLSAWLLLPYLLWVSFAAFLNFSLFRLN